MIGNLKAGADSASSDIGQVIYRMKMLGFNAIRLPFTFAALQQVTPGPCIRSYLPLKNSLTLVILHTDNDCVSPSDQETLLAAPIRGGYVYVPYVLHAQSWAADLVSPALLLLCCLMLQCPE